MKKTFLILLLGSVCCLGTFAQATKTIKGAVIDKTGNPLPGATVEATKGAESTTTDADGTFSMDVPLWLKSVTAKYPGMRDNKQKVKNNSEFLFEMKKGENLTYKWFVGLTGGFVHDEMAHGYVGNIGVTFGRVKKWGWYGHLSFDLNNPSWDAECYRNYTYCSGGSRYTSPFADRPYSYNDAKNEMAKIPTFTAGVIRRLGCPLHLYLGLGFGSVYRQENEYNMHSESKQHEVTTYWGTPQTTSHTDYINYTHRYTKPEIAGALDFGFMVFVKHVFVQLGTNVRVSDGGSAAGLTFGGGYKF